MQTEPMHEKLFRLGKMMSDGINNVTARPSDTYLRRRLPSTWAVFQQLRRLSEAPDRDDQVVGTGHPAKLTTDAGDFHFHEVARSELPHGIFEGFIE